jgi:long-chain fatty acid transport protein
MVEGEAMFRNVALVAAIGLVVMMAGLVHDAMAGGIILYELGTPDVGRASAGWAARANDAATVFTNPAGMARIPGKQLLVGGQLTYGHLPFEKNSNTTVEGVNSGTPVGWLPGGSVFYTHELPSGWNLGIGAFSYFGLATKYDGGWVGRYYVQENGLVGFTLMPSVSYKVNEQLAFGVGFNWMFGYFKQESKIRTVVQVTGYDGDFKMSDNTQGYGANLGGLWELNDETRFGLTYLSPVKLDFKDTPEITGLGPLQELALERLGILGTEVDLGMEVPQMVMASGHHELSEEWTLMGNIGWQNWKNFGKAELSVADTLLTTVDLNYKDTWHVAFGADWDVAPNWLVTGGIAYDSSPINEEDRVVQMPMSDMWRFALGGQWDWTESLELGFAYQLGWMGSLDVDQSRQIGNQTVGRVAGKYANSSLHTFVVNLVWDI